MGLESVQASLLSGDLSAKTARDAAKRLCAECRWSEALALLRRLVRVAPSDVELSLMVADVLVELDRAEEAHGYFRGVADRYAREGAYAKALALEEKIAVTCPDAHETDERIVRLHLELASRTRDAAAVAGHRSQAIARMGLLGDCAAARTDTHEAARWYRKVVELDPLDAVICLKLARLLISLDLRREAVARLIGAAKGLLKNRMLREAGDVIMEAAKLDDNNPDVKALFFRLQLAEGYVRLGLDGLQKLQHEVPDNLEVILTLARAYVSFNQLEVARDWFLKSYFINGDVAPLRYVADRLMERGLPDAALKALQPAAEHLHQAGKTREAISLLEHIHARGHHQATLEWIIAHERLLLDYDRAEFFVEQLLELFGATSRVQEGLVFLWKQLESEQDEVWRVRLQLLTSRFVADGGRSAVLRPFPEPVAPRKSGEFARLDAPTDLSLEDFVASLPNRRLVKDRLAQVIDRARRQDQLVALLLLDLDQRRWEAPGQPELAKQALLKLLCAIKATLREFDTLAHLGGDEFAIVLPQVNSTQALQTLLNRILAEIGTPQIFVEGSISAIGNLGVALYPNDGEQVSGLMQKADSALGRAREKGPNQYALFTERVGQALPVRPGLEGELRAALERGELRLHYQPIVNLQLARPRLVGLEVLTRWPHPRLGLLYPSDFIPLAGEMGLLGELGAWVLEATIAQAKTWYAHGGVLPWMTVNLTADQCRDRGFLSRLRDLMNGHGLPPGVLTLGLESSEALMLDGSDETRELLQQIRRLGVSLAIDDFGAGQTSVVQLQRSPVSAVKIHSGHVRRVVEDKGVAALVRGLVSLARGFDLEVVAEGIETVEQARFLRDAGCHCGQGFFFSKPLHSENVEPLFEGLQRV